MKYDPAFYAAWLTAEEKCRLLSRAIYASQLARKVVTGKQTRAARLARDQSEVALRDMLIHTKAAGNCN